jgi:hypothetical protein
MKNTARLNSLLTSSISSAVLGLVILFFLPHAAHAATFYISPAKATIKVNETKSFSIHVNTFGENINAVSTVLTYPNSLVNVVSITYGSIFNIQAEQSYGNGALRLTRGTTKGATGDIIIATFTVKGRANGTASFTFAADSAATRTANSSQALDLSKSVGAILTVAGTSTLTQTTNPTNPSTTSKQQTVSQPSTISETPINDESNTSPLTKHSMHLSLRKPNGDVYAFLPVTVNPIYQKTRSDKTGTVTLNDLPAGVYTLEATIDNEPQSQSFTVEDSGFVQSKTIVLSAKINKFPLIPLITILGAIVIVSLITYLFFKIRSQNKNRSLDNASDSSTPIPPSDITKSSTKESIGTIDESSS